MTARNAIARFHRTAHKWAWRHYFAGRMIELTQCTYGVAMRRADEALLIDPTNVRQHPRDVCDKRAHMYKPGKHKKNV